MVLLSSKNAALALKSYRLQMVEAGTQDIMIDRQSTTFLKYVIRMYKRPGFNLKIAPEIEFINERGIDAGGLTREFFHLVLTKMCSGDSSVGLTFFEGATDHFVPIHYSSSLDSGLFYLFGKVLAHSILQGGMGFLGMSPAVAKYIATKGLDAAATLISLDDIPDLEYRDYVNKILKASDSAQFIELNEDPTVIGLLDSAGFVGQILNQANAHVAAQQIMMHEVIHKRRCEMMDISSVLLQSMVTVDKSTYSGICQHENALRWLNMYIDKCAKEKRSVTLNDLRMFVTGKPQIGEMAVEFHNDTSRKMPTCSAVLTLPVCHQTYEDFKKQMDNALIYECVGFHLVRKM